MERETVEAILREHSRLCSDLYELFVEEGRIMRTTGPAPDEAFLERKRNFLPVLDKGLELLERINEKPESFPRGIEPLAIECRDKL